MLLLADRAFDSAAFIRAVDMTGALLLVRVRSTRRPPVLVHLPDGSYLSCLDGLQVRIIEAVLTVTGVDGSRVHDSYRLITTLLDHRRYPAELVAQLYHERWEIECAYLSLRHTLLNGHVLRSGDRPGLEQEIWALLTLYQLLRMAMVTAVEARPGTDPDRASFTTAAEAAREQLTAAQGVCPAGPPDLLGVIGRAVLASLLPARRLRYSARKVKCATSRYLNRDDGRPATPTTIASIDIAVHTPPLDTGPARARFDRSTPRPPRAPTRRQRVMAIMDADPGRAWSGRELADRLQITPRYLLTQLAEWARLGFLTTPEPGYTPWPPARHRPEKAPPTVIERTRAPDMRVALTSRPMA
jgi:hypothetical protein